MSKEYSVQPNPDGEECGAHGSDLAQFSTVEHGELVDDPGWLGCANKRAKLLDKVLAVC
jgi:hypothetical protein